MNIRYLNGQEKQKTRSLWEEIFSTDSAKFVDYYYKEKIKNNEILVLEEDEEIVSMLQLNPYKVHFCENIETINYIVAVGTKEKFRKKGYMRKLLITSINDMYLLGQPFSFLMPAAEAIYIPFDFHYIYTPTKSLVESISNINYLKGYEIEVREACSQDIKDMCELSNSLLKANYSIFTYRDTDYYENLIKEVASEGTILLFYSNNILVGCSIYEKECENIWQIREPIFKEGYHKQILNHIITMNKSINANINLVGISVNNENNYNKLPNARLEKKPLIMARIIHLKNFVKNIICKRQIEFSIRVIDEIIEENNRIFLWSINQHGSTLTNEAELLEAAWLNTNSQKGNNHIEAELTISIRYLTAWLFGYISIQELYHNNNIECTESCFSMLKLIKTYEKVFINEIV